MRAQDKIFEMAAEGSNRDEEDGVLSSSGQDKISEDGKRSEAVSPVPRMIDSQSVDKDWQELGGGVLKDSDDSNNVLIVQNTDRINSSR